MTGDRRDRKVRNCRKRNNLPLGERLGKLTEAGT
jgi:hypothetical protein